MQCISDIPWVATHGRSKFVGEISGARLLGHMQFFNGTFLEFFDALATSDGATVTMSVEKSGGGDLTENFSTGQTRFATAPAATIALTAGTDPAPQLNFVYILQSAPGVLVKSTSGWPATEHVRVSIFFVQSASLVNTGAAGNNFLLINQNINEEAATADGQGHLSHIMDRLRHGGGMGGLWHSGCLGTATQDGNDLWVDIAAGTVAQVHHHAFSALDSDTAGAGDPIVVVNDPDAAYAIINSLNENTKLSDGVAIGNNKYVKFVLAAVANKTGAVSPMLLKLPSGQYNTAADAATDVEGYADFSIPDEFLIQSSTGFLIASFVCKHTATAMELQSTVDLRGQAPATMGVGGSIAGGGNVTAAAALTDNALIRGDGGAKGIKTSGILLDASDNMLFPTTAKLQLDNVNQYLHGTSATGVTLNAALSIAFGIAGSTEVTLSANGLNFANGITPTSLTWGTDGQLAVGVDGVPQVTFTDGTFEPVTTNDISHGTITKEWASGWYEGEVKAGTFKSDIGLGNPPFVVASATLVTNLNSDKVDGMHSNDLLLVDGSQALSANWDAGAFEIRAATLQSDIATGTPPLVVASTTQVTNLNASTVTGKAPGTSGNVIALLDGVNTWSAAQTFGTNVKQQYRDANTWINSLASGFLVFEASSSSIFSIGGTTEMSLSSAGLDVVNTVRAESLRADGDAGGVAGTIEYTSTTLANNTPAPTLSNLPTGFAAASALWVAMNIGTTQYVWPVWTA